MSVKYYMSNCADIRIDYDIASIRATDGYSKHHRQNI
jgi:hypothetical protein